MSLEDARANLRAKLDKVGLAARADQIIAVARPCIFLEPLLKVKGSPAIGSSKIGGAPDLPEGFVWPASRMKVRKRTPLFSWGKKKPDTGPEEIVTPLSFIAQVDLAACAAAGEIDVPLPKAGLLSYFYDAVHQDGGFNPGPNSAARLFWHPATEGLRRVAVPTDAKVFPEFQLLASQAMSVPDTIDGERSWSDHESDAYGDFFEGDPAGVQLAGWPKQIQNGGMEEECEAALREPSPEGPKIWRMVLQVDSSDAFGMMWGDSGRLYTWMRESDIRDGRFDRAGTIGQMY